MWKGNTRIDLQEIGWATWTGLNNMAQDRNKWRAFVYTVMKL